MAPVHLLASPDDYLLELEVAAAVANARRAFEGVEPEVFGPETTPQELAVEICSPSLFAPQRILVVPDISSWVNPATTGRSTKGADADPVDAGPVVQALGEGVADDVALILGACSSSKPKGPLVDAVSATGQVAWIPTPQAPKPWEDLVMSKDQERVLTGLLDRTADGVVFTPAARDLLVERLGFAPRALVQEARKLAVASTDGTVDVDLVRSLSFPSERSLEAASEAVLGRTVAPVLDLLLAAQGNALVRDFHGQAMDVKAVPNIVFRLFVNSVLQMLYLRRAAARAGFADELDPGRTSDPKWYPIRFSKGIGPSLLSYLEQDSPSPVLRGGGKGPSVFRLGVLFRGASRYTEQELVNALASAGGIEAALRGEMAVESLTAWITGLVVEP